MDTLTDNNDAKPEEGATVSLEIAQQVRTALADLLGVKAPISPLLEGLPTELWLKRIVPLAVAGELMGGLTSETILKKYRSKCFLLDGRKYGMRLCDALMIEHKKKKAEAAFADSALSDSEDQPRRTSRNTHPTLKRRGGRHARKSR